MNGFAAAFTAPMTITGSAKLYSIYASQAVFNGIVTVKISTDGKFLIAGQLNFAADNISISAKLYADLSKVANGEVAILFLADVPDQVRVLTLYGRLKMGFRNPSGQEVLFVAPADAPLVPQPPPRRAARRRPRRAHPDQPARLSRRPLHRRHGPAHRHRVDRRPRRRVHDHRDQRHRGARPHPGAGPDRRGEQRLALLDDQPRQRHRRGDHRGRELLGRHQPRHRRERRQRRHAGARAHQPGRDRRHAEHHLRRPGARADGRPRRGGGLGERQRPRPLRRRRPDRVGQRARRA